MTTLEPEAAVESYIDSRQEVTPSTRDEHRRRLKKFLAYTEEAGLDDVSELSGIHIEQYRQHRMKDDTTARITDEQNLLTFRVFLRYLERIEVTQPDLDDKVLIPEVSKDEQSRDAHISHERATEIIEWLAAYKWASLEHVVFHLTYHTGLRRSALYGLDVEDWHPDKRVLEVHHRDYTPLKLKEDTERNLSITDDRLVSGLNAWIDSQRHDVQDDWGRNPLFTSVHGRYAYKSLQSLFYRVTRPCWIGVECPHDREPEECEAASHPGYSKCPSSVSSHPMRRSAVHNHLNNNVPKTICSERMAVSEEVLSEHYDKRSAEETRMARKDFLDGV